MSKSKELTARELRRVLFDVTNQELTVRELRKILFEIEEQDEELTDARLAYLTK